MKRPLSTAHGRTLIELLVGLAIAAIVAVSLSRVAVAGFRFANDSRYEDRRVYPVRNTMDVIVKDLRFAQRYYANCYGEQGIFVLPPSSPGQVITYNRNGTRLVRTIWSNATCTGTGTPVERTIIGYEISDFRLTQLLGQLDLRIEAKSADGKTYSLRQQVTARRAG